MRFCFLCREAASFNNPYKYIDPDGNFILYIGEVVGGNAGISGSAASGFYVNITSEGYSFGEYQSGELGAAVAPPSVDAGLEFGYFNSSNVNAAMSGFYGIYGADLVAGAGGSIERVNCIPTVKGAEAPTGYQLTLVGGTPEAGIHGHTGYGKFEHRYATTYADLAAPAIKSFENVGRSFEFYGDLMNDAYAEALSWFED